MSSECRTFDSLLLLSDQRDESRHVGGYDHGAHGWLLNHTKTSDGSWVLALVWLLHASFEQLREVTDVEDFNDTLGVTREQE